MEFGSLTAISNQIGISVGLLIIIFIWEAVWKLIALWKSARNKHLVWFIVLALINSIGILPILYIFVFSKLKFKSKKSSDKKK
jgi:hypothetical protein